MNVRNITTLTVLLFVALGSWYLARSSQFTEMTETVSKASGDGFYLKSARILGTDVDGRALYRIEADYVAHQKSNEIAMQNVQISYSADAEVPWTINADEAMISEDQDLVRLSGHVTAVSNSGFAGQITEIRAPRLNIEPATYKAETNGRVQVRIGSRNLTATGMLALLQDNRLQLRTNVSGKFMP